jgi:hypothetical protein
MEKQKMRAKWVEQINTRQAIHDKLVKSINEVCAASGARLSLRTQNLTTRTGS